MAVRWLVGGEMGGNHFAVCRFPFISFRGVPDAPSGYPARRGGVEDRSGVHKCSEQIGLRKSINIEVLLPIMNVIRRTTAPYFAGITITIIFTNHSVPKILDMVYSSNLNFSRSSW